MVKRKVNIMSIEILFVLRNANYYPILDFVLTFTRSKIWICVLHSLSSFWFGYFSGRLNLTSKDLVSTSKIALRFEKGPGRGKLTHPGTTLEGTYFSSFLSWLLEFNLSLVVTFFTIRQMKYEISSLLYPSWDGLQGENLVVSIVWN